MPYLDIHEYIESVDSNQVAFISGDRKFTYGELTRIHKKHSLRQLCANKKVAIVSENNLFVAFLIIILDGVATSIFLCPDNINHDQLDDYLTRAGTSILISDLTIDSNLVAVIKYNDYADLIMDLDVNDNHICDVDSRWQFTTSGTTGTPKLIEHELSSLSWSTVRDTEVGSTLNWGLCYGLTRFAGFQVFLQAIISGSSVVLTDAEEISRQIDDFIIAHVNAISATPTYWKQLLISGKGAALKLKQVTMGGEIADEIILQNVSAVWPDARVIHIYASTETGVAFSIKDKKAGFPASYIQSPPKGVLLKISENNTLMVKPKHRSISKLCGGQLFDSDGYIDTGDVVEFVDKRILFKGRLSGMINVGGNKVYPEEVEQALLEIDGVIQVVVSGVSNPFTGNIIQAEIMQANGMSEGIDRLKEIKSFCRKRLDGYKVPAIVKFVDKMDMNSANKIQRV